MKSKNPITDACIRRWNKVVRNGHHIYVSNRDPHSHPEALCRKFERELAALRAKHKEV